ncbi:MAG TPA: 2OG-Fe(II) oxygenase [Thermoanaerobaculia bacterium]|jgi:predicted 2-oxoglutarate/Fe(II)-dependent dioxygenase YbiX
MVNTFTIDRFLDSGLVARVVAEVNAAEGAAARIYGGATAVDARVRSTVRVDVGGETRELVAARFEEARETLAAHFERPLQSFEEPQFLRYREGDFFVAHQDGNTPLIHDDTLHRRVSVVVFLNPGNYGGGELTFHGKYPDWQARYPVEPAAGRLVAFPPETTHEVTPVTSGERLTIVTWYR